MLIEYAALYLPVMMLALLERKFSRTLKLSFCIFVAVCFSLFAGYRWQTGTDWYAYYNLYFNDVGRYHHDILFLLWIDLFRGLDFSYTSFLLSQAFLGNALVLWAQHMLKLYSVWPVLIVNVLMTPFWTRQSLAALVMLSAVIFLALNRKRIFILMSVLASGLHVTAAFTLLLLLFGNRTFNLRSSFFILLFSLIIGLCFPVGDFLRLLSDVSVYFEFPHFVTHRIIDYSYRERENTSLSAVVLPILSAIFLILYLKVCTIRNGSGALLSSYRLLHNYFLLGLALNLLTLFWAEPFRRFSLFGTLALSFLVPIGLNTLARRKAFILGLIFALYSTVRVAKNLYNYETEYLPYRSIFSTAE